MKLPFLALALCALPLAASADETWPDAAALPEASYPHAATKVIAIGKGVTITAKFELTEKGNGGLTIPGLGIRVYDAYRDGSTYKNYLLNCDWRDTNADGYLDLVVSGTIQYWDEDRLSRELPVTGVFTYNAAQKDFEITKCPFEIYTWENRKIASVSPTPTPAK